MASILAFINPWVVAGMLVLLVGTGFYGAKLGADHVHAADAATASAAAQSYNSGQTAAANLIAARIPQYADLRQALHDEISSNPAIAACHSGPVLLQLATDAGSNRPVSTGASLLPANLPASK